MKKLAIVLAAFCLLSLIGCVKADEDNIAVPTNSITASSTADTELSNEALAFLTNKYHLKFTLWGPEGQDLYAFHIYPDRAERECHILMPENTDDVAEYHNNLSWEVVGSELVITGEWQETFKIDIAAETATSTTTGKVYQIYEMQPELETEPTIARTLDCKFLEATCAESFIDPSKVTVLGGEWAYTADPNKFVALATVRYTDKYDEYEVAEIVMVGTFGGKTELFHNLNEHSPYTRDNALQEFGAVDDQRFPLE